MAEQNPAEPSALERVEARRAERKAARKAERDAQRALDLEAIDALEVEHGDQNVRVLDVDCSAGLPTCVAARVAKPAELKRYRDTLRNRRDGESPDHVKAGEQLGSVARIYPDAETFAKVLAERPGVLLQLGVAAVELAVARESESGKD